MKLLIKAGAIFDRTLDLAAVLAAALIVFIMLAESAEVVMRYFFRRPFIWVVEISETILLFAAFLGAAWLLRSEGHIKMDLVLNRFSAGPRAIFHAINSLIGAFCCGVLVWYGALMSWSNFVRGAFEPTVLEIPSAYVLVIIPIGAFLFFIQCLRRGYGYLKEWRTSSS